MNMVSSFPWQPECHSESCSLIGCVGWAGCRRLLFLFLTSVCISFLFPATDALPSPSQCQPSPALQGVSVSADTWLPLSAGRRYGSLKQCSQACCERAGCNAAWSLRGRCVMLACVRRGRCQTHSTGEPDSLLVFVTHPEGGGQVQAEDFDWLQDIQNHRKGSGLPGRHGDSRLGLGDERELRRRRELVSMGTAAPDSTHMLTFSNPVAFSLTANRKNGKPSNESAVEAPPPTGQNPTRTTVTITMTTANNTSMTSERSIEPTSLASTAARATAKPGVRELVVSAGNSVEVTLPMNEVELNAFVLPEPPEGSSYTFDWRLITHPKDYSGEMEGKHSQTLKLSKLTQGLYDFEVLVDGEGAHGQGFVNVTVKPEPRVNQPPVAVVSPRFQEISLPTSSTVIDGSQSTDDEHVVSYHWEEVKGPLREEKVSADTPILKLANLVPGNYTFSLTVVDSDGARGSALASLSVLKAVDYPPVANAGPNQVITLPQNSITLFGNQSTDDHGLLSYEWSLSPQSKDKVVEMQGVRTSTLQLSAMQEGDYTYQLTVTDSANQQDTAEVTVIVQPENNKPPRADAGPEKELTLPVDSTTLDGSKSSDDQKIASYRWEKTSGPDGVKIENADSAVATVTGLQVGVYEFTLSVRDERNLASSDTVRVIVKEELNQPPVARISGNVQLALPLNMAALDGSKSSDDKGVVSYQWSRDELPPRRRDVLNQSDRQPVLLLTNLVEGTYTFNLRVSDAKGESSTARGTVEVRPDPQHSDLVEMLLAVGVSQVSERQKGMLIRQIAVLLRVLDSDLLLCPGQRHSVALVNPGVHSTRMVFFVRSGPGRLLLRGQDIAMALRSKLRKQKADFLIFRALQINTVTCQLNCSQHGSCDSLTKRCVCHPFWMENFIRVQLGDAESLCLSDWSVLYVTIASFVMLVAVGILSWGLLCCCRGKGKPKRKSRYKILEGTDDQESLELKHSAKGGARLKAPVHPHSSLLRSESEGDSEDPLFTWPDREKGKLLRHQNGSVRNGHGPNRTRKQSCEEQL
ncbi:dyslexia-associated protein KIAA0319-like protein [Polyodon spathula]|uniref:dyslexia-associated protein KIAA0319-like protein n=1 Tax=Polyodon spathula TaxID=7913 RepID=UPI001B7EE842|nr:dyslexia-associated protein KIAA0319-like protein [Polyodon spathula]